MTINELKSFVNEQNQAHRHIKCCLISDGQDIYAVDFRFTATKYRCSKDDFQALRAAIELVSVNTATVSTDKETFSHGAMTMLVTFCNHSYNIALTKKAIAHFLEETLPSLEV